MDRDRQTLCPHIQTDSFGGLSELTKLIVARNINGLASLFDNSPCYCCKAKGPNLWLCLHYNCSLVMCGESHKDHSSDHYQDDENHCIHLNLYTLRIWCYVCGEVSPMNNNPQVNSKFLPYFSKVEHHSRDVDLSLGIVGLQNLGNTCYMNSALQALSNIPPMTQYFLECVPFLDKETKKNNLAKAYASLIQNMWSNKAPSSIAPTGVLYAVKLVFQMFRGFQQHDSQEFLRCFMDQLHEELKEPIFEGKESATARNESESESEVSEHSESESYLTCDSGVSDDDGVSSPPSENSSGLGSSPSSRKRSRSSSDGEFSDALERSPSPRNTSTTEAGSSSTATKFRSIVSDVFDGQILSSVQCLTCNLVSSRIETFQDLSLPIPSRDQLYFLHQSSLPKNQSAGDVQTSSSWFYWMWSLVWGWFWGPGVSLYDCLSAFFSADELKGDNMYSCEKCKKLRNGVKFSSIVELPEVLTVHLKRFRNEPLFSSKIASHIAFPLRGLDMKPWISRECTSKVTTYDLVGAIVHHGTAGGGHYTCYAYNDPSEQWIEFDDSSTHPVSPETVAGCQAYVLFYRKSSDEMKDFRRHVESISQQESDSHSDAGLLQFYISSQWLSKFRTFTEPGPIHNRDFLCPHGGVQPLKMDRINDVCVPVNAVVWEALHARFGGGPACNRLHACATCQHAQEMMDKRRKDELETFLELQKMFQSEKGSVSSTAVCAIAMNWFRKWELFVKNRDSPLPGPVDNIPITIVRNGNRVLRPSSDFAQLSPALWQFFFQRYGGGPEALIRP